MSHPDYSHHPTHFILDEQGVTIAFGDTPEEAWKAGRAQKTGEWVHADRKSPNATLDWMIEAGYKCVQGEMLVEYPEGHDG